MQWTIRPTCNLVKSMSKCSCWRIKQKKLSERKKISEFIYTAEARFEPFINHTYHLYKREDSSYLLSLIGPKQWGKSRNNFDFVATVKLLADHTWDILEKNEGFEFNA